MIESVAWVAFGYGLLSAASLPLGALLARFWQPGDRTIAALMAFGAGALLAALTIDLVAHALDRGHFYPMAIGCLIGGGLFVGLNMILNSRGGFLRKIGTTVSYLRRRKQEELRGLFERLSRSPVFQALPPEQIRALLPHLHKRRYADGELLAQQGEAGAEMFVIDAGTVRVYNAEAPDTDLAELGAGDVVGEIALVTGRPRAASLAARGDLVAWVLPEAAFADLARELPDFQQLMQGIAEERIHDLQDRQLLDSEQAARWFDQVDEVLADSDVAPTDADVKAAVSEHHGAPLAIWLGILLDGIPESFVIGSSALGAAISFSLIGGLFLANFPEAFSSSIGMREQGYSHTRILLMWGSLTLITGIGAFLGSIFFVGADPVTFSLVEGIAAGAMLTMIAETMLPEAFHKGGSVTGISTLLGFLAAIFLSTLTLH